MKKIIMITTIVAIGFITCKKSDKPEINACGEEVVKSGIGKAQDKAITFWIRKDFGCGKIRVVKILNKTTGSTEYTSVVPEITKYFPSGPICKETGTALLKVLRGYTYEYTFACETKAWRAEFTATCEDDYWGCQLVELKEPVN